MNDAFFRRARKARSSLFPAAVIVVATALPGCGGGGGGNPPPPARPTATPVLTSSGPQTITPSTKGITHLALPTVGGITSAIDLPPAAFSGEKLTFSVSTTPPAGLVPAPIVLSTAARQRPKTTATTMVNAVVPLGIYYTLTPGASGMLRRSFAMTITGTFTIPTGKRVYIETIDNTTGKLVSLEHAGVVAVRAASAPAALRQRRLAAGPGPAPLTLYTTATNTPINVITGRTYTLFPVAATLAPGVASPTVDPPTHATGAVIVNFAGSDNLALYPLGASGGTLATLVGKFLPVNGQLAVNNDRFVYFGSLPLGIGKLDLLNPETFNVQISSLTASDGTGFGISSTTQSEQLGAWHANSDLFVSFGGAAIGVFGLTQGDGSVIPERLQDDIPFPFAAGPDNALYFLNNDYNQSASLEYENPYSTSLVPYPAAFQAAGSGYYCCIAVDASSNVYYAGDTDIEIFAPDGTLSRKITYGNVSVPAAIGGGIFHPTALAVADDGTIYLGVTNIELNTIPGFIAIFAPRASGDATPKYLYDTVTPMTGIAGLAILPAATAPPSGGGAASFTAAPASVQLTAPGQTADVVGSEAGVSTFTAAIAASGASIASVAPTSGSGPFVVTGLAPGSTTLTLTDPHGNTVLVPISVAVTQIIGSGRRR